MSSPERNWNFKTDRFLAFVKTTSPSDRHISSQNRVTPLIMASQIPNPISPPPYFQPFFKYSYPKGILDRRMAVLPHFSFMHSLKR